MWNLRRKEVVVIEVGLPVFTREGSAHHSNRGTQYPRSLSMTWTTTYCPKMTRPLYIASKRQLREVSSVRPQNVTCTGLSSAFLAILLKQWPAYNQILKWCLEMAAKSNKDERRTDNMGFPSTQILVCTVLQSGNWTSDPVKALKY